MSRVSSQQNAVDSLADQVLHWHVSYRFVKYPSYCCWQRWDGKEKCWLTIPAQQVPPDVLAGWEEAQQKTEAVPKQPLADSGERCGCCRLHPSDCKCEYIVLAIMQDKHLGGITVGVPNNPSESPIGWYAVFVRKATEDTFILSHFDHSNSADTVNLRRRGYYKTRDGYVNGPGFIPAGNPRFSLQMLTTPVRDSLLGSREGTGRSEEVQYAELHYTDGFMKGMPRFGENR